MNLQLSIAVPWSLTHYIPLNGFHPLYHALFESKPDWVNLAALDNIEFSHTLRGDENFRRNILHEIRQDTELLKLHSMSIENKYFEQFWAPNRSLTRLLPGDIEFHHTAPYPSLERPFIFHCESFAPIFFPFAHQGTGSLSSSKKLRKHYQDIFEHPLCLGIFSHLPQTLENISRFFSSKIINDRLFDSGIGLHSNKNEFASIDKGPLSAPVFLFVNSAHQRVGNFFLRGGHLALRYWQLTYSEPGAGRLVMRCARPPDEMLAKHGVDLNWLRRHEQRSVVWIENYISAADLTSLMQTAHFLLLPSASLHSVSIMSAMAAGAVPIVSDTMGTDRYVKDAVDGVVLKGVYASNWSQDRKTGIMMDRYRRNLNLENDLVQQLVSRLGRLLSHPEQYAALQSGAFLKARETFSGSRFSENFWQKVMQCYKALPETLRTPDTRRKKWPNLTHCLLKQADWQRVFTSPPQPVSYPNSGKGNVVELGGCYVASSSDDSHDLHHWSPVAEYVDNSLPHLIFSTDIKDLPRRSYPNSEPALSATSRLITFVANRLRDYPILFSVAARLLRKLRKINRAFLYFFSNKILPVNPDTKLDLSDIELIIDEVKGFSVIRCSHIFYAIPQTLEVFSLARLERGEYSPCLRGTNRKEILQKIDELWQQNNQIPL